MGVFPLKSHLEAAAKIAEAGFPLDRTYAERLAGTAEELKRFPGARSIFLRPDGRVFGRGENLKQADLAKSYRALGEEGIGWFYGGAFARSVEGWMRENGGILTAADFQNYRVKLREPLRTSYRD